MLENDDNININLNQKLFIKVLHKISKVIKYNYLDDFYKEKCNELLSIPTNLYKNYIPNLEFNSLNTRIQRKEHNKNINIFETLNATYNYSQSVASDPRIKGNNTISSNNWVWDLPLCIINLNKVKSFQFPRILHELYK